MTTLQLLKLVPPLRHIPPLHLLHMAQTATQASLQQGQCFVQGLLPPQPALYLVSGIVALATHRPGSADPLLLLPATPGWINMSGTLRHDAQPLRLEPLAPTTLVSIAAPPFAEAVRTNPELALALAAQCASEARDRQEQLACFAHGGATSRLAYVLLRFAGAIFGSQRFTLPADQQTLALMIGCTREATNRALATLRRGQLIEADKRHIEIVDPEALRGLIE